MRIRSIKPEFFSDEQLAALPPLIRLVYQGLWCLADRAGRLEDRPVRIKACVLPYDDCDIDEFLGRLADGGFIQRYESGGRKYIQIRTFEKHQRPHHREPESSIPPAPLKKEGRAGAKPGRGTARPARKGREGNGEGEGNGENPGTPGHDPAEPTALVLANASKAVVADRFVACFDATFDRAVGVTPEISSKVESLLRGKYRPWQIVACPILVDANGLDARFRKELRPEILLRDGKHPRTGAGGQTTGATHWLERELQRADRTVLDERLAEIAKQFGVLEPLMQIGVSLRQESGL